MINKILSSVIVCFLILIVFPVKALAGSSCDAPDVWGTVSTSSTSAVVEWRFRQSLKYSRVDKVELELIKKGESFDDVEIITVTNDMRPVEASYFTYEYNFSGLTPNTTYLWKLKTICKPVPPSEIGPPMAYEDPDVRLGSFLTVDPLNIRGLLFVGGSLVTNKKRVEVDSNFEYITNSNVSDLLTKAVGQGRIHILNID